MEDFRIKTSWRTSRKRRRLKRLLGAEGVLAIEDLWSYCAAERESGDLEGMSNEDIADEVAWEGDADELIDAFVACGLLDGEPGAYVIHDWEDHNPYVATGDNRSRTAAYKAHVRWHAKRGEKNDDCEWCNGAPAPQQCTSNAPACTSNADSNADHANGNAPSLPPSIPTCPPTDPTNPTDLREATPPGDAGWPEPVVEGDGSGPPQERARGSPSLSREVQSVYGRYREYHPGTPGTLKSSSKAYRAIASRLKEGWTVADLHRAIDGYHVSPWHTGENPGGKKYLGLELMMRDFDKVKAGHDYLAAKDAPVLSEKTKRSMRAARSFAERIMNGGET